MGKQNFGLAVGRTSATLSLEFFSVFNKTGCTGSEFSDYFLTEFVYVWKKAIASLIYLKVLFVCSWQYRQYYHSSLKIAVVSFHRQSALKFKRKGISIYTVWFSMWYMVALTVSQVVQRGIWSIECEYVELVMNNVKRQREHWFKARSFCELNY